MATQKVIDTMQPGNDIIEDKNLDDSQMDKDDGIPQLFVPNLANTLLRDTIVRGKRYQKGNEVIISCPQTKKVLGHIHIISKPQKWRPQDQHKTTLQL